MERASPQWAAFLLLLSLALGLAPAVQAADSVSAKAGDISIALNGKSVRLGVYNIADSNYVKLRDVAQLLRGTEKSFGVAWNGEAQSIDLSPWEDYTPVGGELSPLPAGIQTAFSSAASVRLYGTELPLTAYTIDGNNYFKLRDLGAALDFRVDWNASDGTVVVDTAQGYQAPAGGADATSDGELMVLAAVAGNDMRSSIYGVNLGAILEQDWSAMVTVGGQMCYPVSGCSSLADLDSYWHQSFSRKYTMDEVTGGAYRNMFIESGGSLFSVNQGIGGDMTITIVDGMVSRSGDEAVFKGWEVFEDGDSAYDPTPVEFSLVYENGTWMYGYYRTMP